MGSNEPPHLLRGEAFHRQVQADWLANADCERVLRERACTKPIGRRGRTDVFVEVGGDGNLVAIVEVKGSDWQKMKVRAVECNAPGATPPSLGLHRLATRAGDRCVPGRCVPEAA